MRKIKLFIANSLDGYIARVNGSVDWLPTNVDSGYNEFYNSVDTVFMGRTTYDQILTFGKYPYDGKEGYVFTTNTQTNKDENVEFVSNVEEFIKKLVAKPGKDIWLVGGSGIISTLLDNNLIDEIILSIIPVVLGKGISLFKNSKKETKLQLIKSTKYSGLVELHYIVLKST